LRCAANSRSRVSRKSRTADTTVGAVRVVERAAICVMSRFSANRAWAICAACRLAAVDSASNREVTLENVMQNVTAST
jgi:hypothetical protein